MPNHHNPKALYAKLVGCAAKALDTHRYGDCIDYLKGAAYCAYSYLSNIFLSDNNIEYLLQKLSAKLVNRIAINDCISGRCVFYDAFSWDNRGLSQQYIRALIDNDIEFIYISENKELYSTAIFKELTQYKRVEIVIAPNLNSDKRNQICSIYEIIAKYAPSKVLLHIKPWSVEALIAIAALPDTITKYNINLTDHAFWLGSRILNYNIEFRKYGCLLSYGRRSLQLSQLLLQPYYPIINDCKFQGFPIEKRSNDVFLFSGSNLYKIYDKENTFLSIIKEILEKNTNAYFLFAGGGDARPFKSFVKKNKLCNRIFYLGFRQDINEVVKNIDIYIDTFPVSGGLMGEYAIVNRKPVLILGSKDSSYNRRVDSLSSLFPAGALSELNGVNDFVNEATRLINDTEYRKQQGDKNQYLVPTRKDFGSKFIKMITLNLSPNPIIFDDDECHCVIDDESKNTNSDNYVNLGLIKLIGLKMIYIAPVQCVESLIFLSSSLWLKFLLKKIKKYCNAKFNK